MQDRAQVLAQVLEKGQDLAEDLPLPPPLHPCPPPLTPHPPAPPPPPRQRHCPQRDRSPAQYELKSQTHTHTKLRTIGRNSMYSICFRPSLVPNDVADPKVGRPNPSQINLEAKAGLPNTQPTKSLFRNLFATYYITKNEHCSSTEMPNRNRLPQHVSHY